MHHSLHIRTLPQEELTASHFPPLHHPLVALSFHSALATRCNPLARIVPRTILFITSGRPGTSMSSPVNSTTGGVVWQPEPDGRGSFGILSSCVLTLVFCVWTAVHPNVGFQRLPILYWGESRAALLITALLSPEFIIYFAWAQNHAARRLNRQVGLKSDPFPTRVKCLVWKYLRKLMCIRQVSTTAWLSFAKG